MHDATDEPMRTLTYSIISGVRKKLENNLCGRLQKYTDDTRLPKVDRGENLNDIPQWY